MPIVPPYAHLVDEPPAAALPATWMVLHGSDGDERAFLPHARRLVPGAALICPRGRDAERGRPRYFRRLSQTVIDVEDARFRARELAAFFRSARREYGLPGHETGLMGLEGGATAAAALLLLEPAEFRLAVLFRPMLPFAPGAPLPDLAGLEVRIAAATGDLVIPAEETHELTAMLERCGARVTLAWSPCGHGLTPAELDDAAAWLAERRLRHFESPPAGGAPRRSTTEAA